MLKGVLRWMIGQGCVTPSGDKGQRIKFLHTLTALAKRISGELQPRTMDGFMTWFGVRYRSITHRSRTRSCTGQREAQGSGDWLNWVNKRIIRSVLYRNLVPIVNSSAVSGKRVSCRTCHTKQVKCDEYQPPRSHCTFLAPSCDAVLISFWAIKSVLLFLSCL